MNGQFLCQRANEELMAGNGINYRSMNVKKAMGIPLPCKNRNQIFDH